MLAIATAQLDDRTVIITGGDGIRVWDLATGDPITQLTTGGMASVGELATAELAEQTERGIAAEHSGPAR